MNAPSNHSPGAFPVGVVIRAVGPRPSLWLVAVRTVLRLASPGWWRRWPPLPLPPERYWRFRMTTAYGGTGDAVTTADDVVAYLQWCRRGGGGYE